MAYIKQRSSYVINTKHKSTDSGTIFEHDITTIGGLNAFGKNQYPIYQSGNFILSVNLENNFSKYVEAFGWEENENGTKWTLADVADVATNESEVYSPVKLKADIHNLGEFAYYGSSTELLRSSLNNIIQTFPGEGCAAFDYNGEPVLAYYTVETDNGLNDAVLGGEGKILFDNPFNVDFYTEFVDDLTFSQNPLKYFACNNSWKDNFNLIVNSQVSDISSIKITKQEFGTDNYWCLDPNQLIVTILINNTYKIGLFSAISL